MSETYDFDLVAIGSGPAGQRAAVQAAKLGKRAAVIEKNRYVGGVCVETGTIPEQDVPGGGVGDERGAGPRSPAPPRRSSLRASATSSAGRSRSWTTSFAATT